MKGAVLLAIGILCCNLLVSCAVPAVKSSNREYADARKELRVHGVARGYEVGEREGATVYRFKDLLKEPEGQPPRIVELTVPGRKTQRSTATMREVAGNFEAAGKESATLHFNRNLMIDELRRRLDNQDGLFLTDSSAGSVWLHRARGGKLERWRVEPDLRWQHRSRLAHGLMSLRYVPAVPIDAVTWMVLGPTFAVSGAFD